MSANATPPKAGMQPSAANVQLMQLAKAQGTASTLPEQ